MKPRRISFKALSNLQSIISSKYERLTDIAEIVENVSLFNESHKESDLIHLIEGQDIRAGEGIVVLKGAEKRWQIEVRKASKGYAVKPRDIIVGLVRPERRNIGFYTHTTANVFASVDGVAVVRERADKKDCFPIEWIFQALRTERRRLQFWTESGGTSYGKLNLDQIKNVLIPIPDQSEIDKIANSVRTWSDSVAQASNRFHEIWDSHDKVVILNSPITGLEAETIPLGDDEDE